MRSVCFSHMEREGNISKQKIFPMRGFFLGEVLGARMKVALIANSFWVSGRFSLFNLRRKHGWTQICGLRRCFLQQFCPSCPHHPCLSMNLLGHFCFHGPLMSNKNDVSTFLFHTTKWFQTLPCQETTEPTHQV